MRPTRRSFLEFSACGVVGTLAGSSSSASAQGVNHGVNKDARHFRFVQIDVFSSQRLEGNPLVVFPDARGLSDAEMQALARETNLQETTFVIPRETAVERERGIRVRIFTPEEEIPFGGHPSLGTAMVLRNRLLRDNTVAPVPQIVLDLKVGRIPVTFTDDASGAVFGEMQQVEPVFGQVHQRETVAALVGIAPEDISDEGPIQTISTGLPFAIVPLKSLRTLQFLDPDPRKVRTYFERGPHMSDFYYVTRDTQDPAVGIRARGLFSTGEDPATGSAAGCAISWMVRYGAAKSSQTVHIEQGVEMKRPSQIFARADKQDDKILNVRVGGHAVEVMEGEYSL
jgi:trans-2,3-dihydro-3-hydroxyanthranilate isomerase